MTSSPGLVQARRWEGGACARRLRLGAARLRAVGLRAGVRGDMHGDLRVGPWAAAKKIVFSYQFRPRRQFEIGKLPN